MQIIQARFAAVIHRALDAVNEVKGRVSHKQINRSIAPTIGPLAHDVNQWRRKERPTTFICLQSEYSEHHT